MKVKARTRLPGFLVKKTACDEKIAYWFKSERLFGFLKINACQVRRSPYNAPPLRRADAQH
ncbi:hypothetical protein, partial [Musicola paradisiaca]|uniref:hypothetical protein n=1 Tax=Musicola paradisiaca TaxID=69223 RepID=UPI003F2326A8